MAQRRSCPICGKRRASRYCPAKGESICAVCCGTERESTIDCPPHCPYLIAAYRYEEEHRKPVPENELPFPDVQPPAHVLYEQQPLVSGLGYTILKSFADRQELTDADVLTAIHALAEAYRTLLSGIYYEKPPASPPAAELYAALAGFLQECKQQAGEQAAFASLKDTDVFHVLVFLARLGRSRTGERPRTRRFLVFLRTQLPDAAAQAQPETSRIIVP